MTKVTARRRTVLGGAMHGEIVTILHGSTMRHMPSGTDYRRFGEHWWVPSTDSDEEATERVQVRRRQIVNN